MSFSTIWEAVAVILTAAFGILGVASALVTSHRAERQAWKIAELNANAPLAIDAVHRRNRAYTELLEYVHEINAIMKYPNSNPPPTDTEIETLIEKTSYTKSGKIATSLLLNGSSTAGEAFGTWIGLKREIAKYLKSRDDSEICERYGDLNQAIEWSIELSALIFAGIEREVRGESGLAAAARRDRAERESAEREGNHR